MRAQVSPNGAEFQVNSYTTHYQCVPAVVAKDSGEFVVVWESTGSYGTDTDGYSIQAQRYSAAGQPLGGEFQINSYTTNSQFAPAASADGAGNIVVAWHGRGSTTSDLYDYSIQARRYDAAGQPLGAQFQVNSYTTGAQYFAAVAAASSGNFVVVWASYGSSGTDTSSLSIQGQRYDAGGVPLGGQFQVNTYTTSVQRIPAVALDAEGYFVVAWASYGSNDTDTSSWSIQAQRYDGAGMSVGGEFQVNSYTTDRQFAPAVAADASGNFVVVWESWGSSGSDTYGYSIQGQRYNAAGQSIGGQFQANTYTTYTQLDPSVAADASGSFVVAWVSDGSSGSDQSYVSIQAQRCDAAGQPLGGEFQVNSYTTSRQQAPVVTADSSGNFVVVWESWGSSGTDTDRWSIQGQRFDSLFRDGFESADTARWSAAVPYSGTASLDSRPRSHGAAVRSARAIIHPETLPAAPRPRATDGAGACFPLRRRAGSVRIANSPPTALVASDSERRGPPPDAAFRAVARQGLAAARRRW